MAAQPANVNFGAVSAQQTADASFTVMNSGGGVLTGSISTTAPFSIVSGGSFSLGTGQSQTVTVRFAPTPGGSVSNGQATISSNGGTASVSLVGIGGTSELPSGPRLTVVESNLLFGLVGVGQFLDRNNLNVTNSGQGTLNVTATTSAPFSIVDGASFSLGPGQFRRITVRFSPTVVGPVSGAVSVSSNGGNHTAEASGTGTMP